MSRLFVILAAIAGVILFAGCTKQNEQTSATKVENPAEATTPAQATAPTAPAPAPAPEKTTVSKGGFTTTKSGLQYKDKKAGSGPAAKPGDTVTVNYTGSLDNGEVFDTSKKDGREPFSFTIGGGQVIKGWEEGLQGMKVGGVRELTIPPALGYGSDDMGKIPPNSTLHFEIELLKIGG